MLFLLATNAAEKSIPWLFARALDALGDGRLGAVRDYALVVIGVAALMWVVRTLSRVWLFNVGRDVEFDLRNELLARVHALGPSFFRRMGTGEIMSRATNDLTQVRLLVGFAGLNVVNSVLAFVSALVLMVALSPELTLYALAPYPLLVIVTRRFGAAIFARSLAAQRALGALADRASETVQGTRLVRAMGMTALERRRFERANERAVQTQLSLVLLRGLMWPVLGAVTASATVIVIAVGGRMVLAGDLSAGELAAFLAYLGLLVWPTLALGYTLSVFERGRASYGRVREILDAAPDVADPPSAKQAKGIGALRVRGLGFSHGERQVLADVDLDVRPGEWVAVVGSTGSGRSTLAALLARMLPTPPGSVFLDGDDVTELSLESLRDSVGYAQQEPFLFSTTIRQNLELALDDPGAADAEERIRRAAADACVLAEIEAMPDGLDTVVGERGVQLSGGQKQRVALARALLADPDVLVLDDPMSAVDVETERAILDALDRRRARSLVLITNRLAAASRADRVVVLHEGRVVESGTHAELAFGGGLYARLWARQELEQELLAS